MQRAKLALSILSALAMTASPAWSQAPAEPQKSVRLQPKDETVMEKVDGIFGMLIGAVTLYPFHNVAPWFGIDSDPQWLRDDTGEPISRSVVLKGHQGAVTQAVLSPDGATVLTVGADQTVRLFNLRGEQLSEFAHPAAITAAAFFPAGGEFATGAADGKVRLFATAKNEHGKTVRDEAGNKTWAAGAVIDGHKGGIAKLVYSKDGAWLATAGADGVVTLWDDKGQASTPLTGAEGGVVQIAITAGQERLEERVILVDGAGALRIRKANGSIVTDITDKGITGVTLADDESHILAQTGGTQALTIYTLDGVETGVITLPEGASRVRTAVSNTETGVVVDILDNLGVRRKYDVKGNQIDKDQTATATAADGFLAKASANPNSLALRSLASKQVWVLAGHSDRVLGSSFSSDGTRLVTHSADGTARIWEWFVRGPDGKPVTIAIPFVVLWLVIAAVVFTIYMKFVNLRMFGHAIQVVRGKYSNPEDVGEVSHFQALASALSATVGLGNIAGVAIAVSIGGPGATFWMIVAGLLGMTLKFTECTLGQRFRKIDAQGHVSGGPMHYLWDGLSQKKLGILGAPLAIIFTVFCIGGSLAGGNAFQVNQSGGILKEQVPFFAEHTYVYGLILAVLVGIVIIGGIKRIAHTAEAIVPTMCGIYVLAALTVLAMNIEAVPGAFGSIFGSALSGDAIYGGALGSLVTGFRRAAFSNEAGVGSASIAHSAARTPYAVREGIVALLEPFIDTVVVCTMTALVIVITGVYDADKFPQFQSLVAENKGAGLTAQAFGLNPVLSGWFPWVLMAAVILFAFSTMISWSYYGERCWTNLFGPKSSLSYKVLFLAFTVLGSMVTATNVLEFGDVMILLMAFPNILGLYFLGGLVKKDLTEYEGLLQAGELKTYK